MTDVITEQAILMMVDRYSTGVARGGKVLYPGDGEGD